MRVPIHGGERRRTNWLRRVRALVGNGPRSSAGSLEDEPADADAVSAVGVHSEVARKDFSVSVTPCTGKRYMPPNGIDS